MLRYSSDWGCGRLAIMMHTLLETILFPCNLRYLDSVIVTMHFHSVRSFIVSVLGAFVLKMLLSAALHLACYGAIFCKAAVCVHC